MNEKLIWKQDLTFTGVTESGVSLQIGGEGGIKPPEMLMMSLAGCTGMDVISILQKKQQNVTSFELRLESTRRESHPRAFTSATIHYHITGDAIDESAVARSIELSVTKYCTISSTLSQAMPLGFVYHIYNLNGELVSEGTIEAVAEL